MCWFHANIIPFYIKNLSVLELGTQRSRGTRPLQILEDNCQAN